MAGPSSEVEQAKRLERSLARVRWFAILLGVYSVSQTNTGLRPYASHAVLWSAYALLGLTAAINLGIHVVTARAHTARATTYTRTEKGTQVQVLLDEYKIHMPTTIPAGDVTFNVKNTGSHKHSIEISGQGVDAVFGCITTGEVWQFLRLANATFTIDELHAFIGECAEAGANGPAAKAA